MGKSGQDLTEDQSNLDLATLASRVAELEQRLGSDSEAAPGLGFSDRKVAILAHSIYRARQRRLKHFDAELFGEPAWDMLLDLFVHFVRGERVSTTSLGLAARVPHATAHRWIDILIAKGLVERLPATDDRRLSIIELTPVGFRQVRDYVVEGIGKFDMPAPDPVTR